MPTGLKNNPDEGHTSHDTLSIALHKLTGAASGVIQAAQAMQVENPWQKVTTGDHPLGIPLPNLLVSRLNTFNATVKRLEDQHLAKMITGVSRERALELMSVLERLRDQAGLFTVLAVLHEIGGVNTATELMGHPERWEAVVERATAVADFHENGGEKPAPEPDEPLTWAKVKVAVDELAALRGMAFVRRFVQAHGVSGLSALESRRVLWPAVYADLQTLKAAMVYGVDQRNFEEGEG